MIGMTGATGAALGVRLLQVLHELDFVETHLVLSKWARTTISMETDWSAREVLDLADVTYSPHDQGAAISSGSFRMDGAIIVPCSMKSLSAIRYGYADDLIPRAADVALKERRKLVIVPRETPLNSIHLENMLELSRMGAVILPPMPAFYTKPASVDEIVDHLVARVLDQFDISMPGAVRWNGMSSAASSPVLREEMRDR
jgi:4-hydroxy-3-polyprenylbenzoate decarboxylase